MVKKDRMTFPDTDQQKFLPHSITGGATWKAWPHERTTSQVVANEGSN